MLPVKKVNSMLILEVLKIALVFAERAKLRGFFRYVGEWVARIIFVWLANKETWINCWWGLFCREYILTRNFVT